MASPNFWENQERAQATVGELKALRAVVDPLTDALRSAADLEAMLEMAEEDEEFAQEVVNEIVRLEAQADELELKALLDGPHDGAGAIVTINARDGGTDANDWAEMLLRMYLQWAQQHGYTAALLDRNDNEEAGINSATIVVRGPMAYGIGWFGSVPSMRKASDRPALPPWMFPPKWRTTSSSKSTTRTFARTHFAPAVPAVST